MPNEVIKFDFNCSVAGFSCQKKSLTPLSDFILASLEIPSGDTREESFEVAEGLQVAAVVLREKNFGKTTREVKYRFSDGPEFLLQGGSEVLLGNAIEAFSVVEETDEGPVIRFTVTSTNTGLEEANKAATAAKQALQAAQKDVDDLTANAPLEEKTKVMKAFLDAKRADGEAKAALVVAEQPALIDVFLGFSRQDDE